jgi:hypothetical protein
MLSDATLRNLAATTLSKYMKDNGGERLPLDTEELMAIFKMGSDTSQISSVNAQVVATSTRPSVDSVI